MQDSLFAFLLAFVASLGTFVGGVFVVIFVYFSGGNFKSNKIVGVLQWFFIGVAVFGCLEIIIFPHDHTHHDDSDHIPVDSDSQTRDSSPRRDGLRKRPIKKSKDSSTSDDNKLSKDQIDLNRTGLVTFLALFLHNIPEGLGVYLAAMANKKLGLELAVAIMLHNIPEGMAVALPLWSSTKSYSYVLYMTLLNGLAEPLGVLIGGYILKDYMSSEVLSKCLAAVAGIMACISLHELQPAAIRYAGKDAATVSLFLGMFLCFCSLEVVAMVFFSGSEHQHHHHH